VVTREGDQQVTGLLLAWRAGDAAALDQLMPLVYDELHQIAQRCMRREQAAHSVQATALVNEAYLRLVDARVDWQDRTHFLALSARLMRRILVEHARARAAEKRGGDAERITLAEGVGGSDEQPLDVIALNDALDALARFDVRKGQVVELRIFGGLSVQETATALAVSPETVMRDWKLAKVWLTRELKGGSGT
jgi:RNA polymerase sigma factor (TIGR02999 family)